LVGRQSHRLTANLQPHECSRAVSDTQFDSITDGSCRTRVRTVLAAHCPLSRIEYRSRNAAPALLLTTATSQRTRYAMSNSTSVCWKTLIDLAWSLRTFACATSTVGTTGKEHHHVDRTIRSRNADHLAHRHHQRRSVLLRDAKAVEFIAGACGQRRVRMEFPVCTQADNPLVGPGRPADQLQFAPQSIISVYIDPGQARIPIHSIIIRLESDHFLVESHFLRNFS